MSFKICLLLITRADANLMIYTIYYYFFENYFDPYNLSSISSNCESVFHCHFINSSAIDTYSPASVFLWS